MLGFSVPRFSPNKDTSVHENLRIVDSPPFPNNREVLVKLVFFLLFKTGFTQISGTKLGQ